jgi:myo-inositol-1(or 4)-monophosphatase
MFELELEHVKKLAKKTGLFLGKTTVKEIDSEEGRDIKLALDKEAERMIISSLNSAFDYPFLSEEAGEVGVIVAGQPYWIIDPIDGTMNFSREIPLACISIALWKDDQPLLGVVYDFYRDELFSGLIDEGAWLNEKKISRPKKRTTDQSILMTGIPTFMAIDEASQKEFVSEIFRYKKVRMIGSAALSLCYVSCGRADAYFEKNIRLWDIAAGLAIAKSLNLVLETTDNKDYFYDTFVCS